LSKRSSIERSSSRLLEDDAYLHNGGELSLSSESLTEILKAVLERGAPFRFKAKGSSMYPFINDGDVVTLSRLQSPPGLGDVIAFRHLGTGKLAVHRVVGIRGSSYLIKGDNVAETDGLIPGENVLGRVIRSERIGREVPLGLGQERQLIAVLSRNGLLFPIMAVYRLVCSLIRGGPS
jgi:hypothetical protein